MSYSYGSFDQTHGDAAASPPAHVEPALLCLDMNRVSNLLDISREDLRASLAMLPDPEALDLEPLHLTALHWVHGDLNDAAEHADAQYGTHLTPIMSPRHASQLRSQPMDMESMILRLTRTPDSRASQGCVVPLGLWGDLSESRTQSQTTEMSPVQFVHMDLQKPQLGVGKMSFADSILDIIGHRSPSTHRGTTERVSSVADVAAVIASDNIGTGQTAFIVGAPGVASALLLPDSEEREREKKWEVLPSAVERVSMTVTTAWDSEPRIYILVRYSQPLMAWALCLLGLLSWAAIGPIYECFPDNVRQTPFRIGMWRNAFALCPFLVYLLVHWARHGMSAEHKAFVCNPQHWPVLLLPGAVCHAHLFYGPWAMSHEPCAMPGRTHDSNTETKIDTKKLDTWKASASCNEEQGRDWNSNGRGGRLVVLLFAAGGSYWPLAIYRYPSFGPFPSTCGGVHRPLTTLCPPSPSLAYPDLLTLPFPWSVVPTEPPDCPYFTTLCRVRTEEGSCPRHWPGASKWIPHTSAGGLLSNGGFRAQGHPLVGLLPRSGDITTIHLSVPVLSPPCGERIISPPTPLVSVVCVLCVRSVAWPKCHPGWWPRGGVECWVWMGWMRGDGAVLG